MPRLPQLRRAALGAILAALTPTLAPAQDVTVFAAASTKTAFDEIIAAWKDESGRTAVASYAGSSALARQIEAGAPADIFVSANEGWMDALDDAGLLRPGTRSDLLRNELVLVSHGAGPRVDIVPGFDLFGMLGDERLAMALVDAVPAGIYGKAALEALDVWEQVAPKVAQTDSVRAALALVAIGEAPFGIVYATDAAADDRVTVVGTFPPETHPPIVYPVAIMADSTSPEAEDFLRYITGARAAEAFRRHGFHLVAPPG